MNSGELIRQKIKAANIYIGRPQPTDASLITWKAQARAAKSDTSTPSIVPTVASSSASGVMQFATGKESEGCITGVVQTHTGKCTNGEYSARLMASAGCAVCSDTDYSTNPGGITLPCYTYETRQRYPITNAAGVIVDSNTYLNTIGVPCGTLNDGLYRPPNNILGGTSNTYVNNYGGGLVFPSYGDQQQLRNSFPSN
jgi:hypothetical protein